MASLYNVTCISFIENVHRFWKCFPTYCSIVWNFRNRSFEAFTVVKKLEQLERLRSEDTPATSWLPIPLSHIGSQVKRRQSSNFLILKWALHATHLLKLLDKMCNYEMDPMSIIEDTERTWFCPQTDRQTDGQRDGQRDRRTDRRPRWYQYTPLSTSLKRGYDNIFQYHWISQAVITTYIRADSRLAPSQWETSLQSNAVSHWLGTNLESALNTYSCHCYWSIGQWINVLHWTFSHAKSTSAMQNVANSYWWLSARLL